MQAEQYQKLKRQVIAQIRDLSDVAKETGMHTLSAELVNQRIPKMEKEQFSLVVLGEFNHGKSTFVNALLGSPVLPSGITPTTATINHLVYAKTPVARAVLLDGTEYDVDPKALSDWVTVENASNDQVRYIEVGFPAEILSNHITLVDTPGVNDMNETRAEITYQYIPQADLVLFLLDANQMLKQSERLFLQQRLLRRSKDKLIFILGKSDLLRPEEQAEALLYCKKNLSLWVDDPMIFPVSARLFLEGDKDRSGIPALLSYLDDYFSQRRGFVLLDNAILEGTRLSRYVRQNVGMKRRSLQLSVEELELKIASIQKEMLGKQQTLKQVQQNIDAEAMVLKAKVKLDLQQFTQRFCESLQPQIDKASARDIELYFQGFLQDTIKAFVEQEGEEIAVLLDRLVEQIIQVTNENLQETLSMVSSELGIPIDQSLLGIDGIKYDVGLFALGALGTGIYLFVNTFVGGLLTLAAPLLGVLVRAWLHGQIKQQAKEQAPIVVQKTLDAISPRFVSLIDEVSGRLNDFVQSAGRSLYQGISEVLLQALSERKEDGQKALQKEKELDHQIMRLDQIQTQCEQMQKELWTS